MSETTETVRKERTERDILSKMEDYSRATMLNTDRTAKNVAFMTWLAIIPLILGAIYFAITLV